jgi:uncharacterized protein YjeT (DUF2065 family)
MGGPSRDGLVTEARAKITWGSPQLDVERALIKKGATPAEARTIVRELMEERDASFRAKGTRDVVVGGVLLFVGLFGVLFLWSLPRVVIQLLVLLLFVVGIGITMTVRGIVRIQTGGSHEGHDSDVSE